MPGVAGDGQGDGSGLLWDLSLPTHMRPGLKDKPQAPEATQSLVSCLREVGIFGQQWASLLPSTGCGRPAAWAGAFEQPSTTSQPRLPSTGRGHCSMTRGFPRIHDTFL